jgi:hypothetical protein
MNKRIPLFILIFFLFAIGLYFVIISGEIKENYYMNMDAVRKSGAIDAGWIPAVIPDSSKEIYERHDLDTNAVWLKFAFDKRDVDAMLAEIEELKASEIDTVAFSKPNIKWWPKDLGKDSIRKGEPGLKIYKYNRILQYADNRQKTVPAFFIIDWNSNIAYYWQYGS